MKKLRSIDRREFAKRLYDRVFDADIFSSAAQVAFYFSFAIFPLLFFLVSLIGILLDSSDGMKNELFSYLQQLMPLSVFELVRKTISEIIANSTGGKATIGLLITLWSASAGVDALRSALNSVNKLKEARYWWTTKAQSLSLTFVISTLAALVLAVVFYGMQLVQYGLAGFGLELSSPWLLILIQWVSTLALMMFACEVIYNLLPNFKDRKWVWITPGSVVAISLWIILTSSFRIYLSYFNSYNKAYGSLGAVIIMMLWLYLTASALLIGGSINAVLHEMHEEEEA